MAITPFFLREKNGARPDWWTYDHIISFNYGDPTLNSKEELESEGLF